VSATRTLLACLATLAAASCSLAPRYSAPAVEQVSGFKEAGSWQPGRPADAEPRGAWWEAFSDPKLSEIETALDASNPDLAAAIARFDQARAVARRAHSDVFPTLSGAASARRERFSANAPLSPGPITANDFIASLDLSWEIDLFGRLRSAAASAGSQAQASAADAAATRLALQAELATDYFSLRGDDATVRLLEDTVKAYDRAFDLTRNRYQGGIAAATDVDQADTQRQNARAQLAATRLDRAQLEHAIAVLLGRVPSNFTLDPGTLAAEPPPTDAGLPSTLLERRPDVARAERTLAAANAGIGVARAAWFPVFVLGGTAGYQSIDASTWLEAPSRFWSVGPSGQVPLLDVGARSALTHQARAAYDEALANYRKTTLTAYQEVEDNLAALHHLADELTADEAASVSAQSSAYHADQRYSAGVADYVEVTTTQTAALSAQRAALAARVARLNATVALVRATGGGFKRDDLTEVARQ
jgi:multidrug efflux system outer membrane protein